MSFKQCRPFVLTKRLYTDMNLLRHHPSDLTPPILGNAWGAEGTARGSRTAHRQRAGARLQIRCAPSVRHLHTEHRFAVDNRGARARQLTIFGGRPNDLYTLVHQLPVKPISYADFCVSVRLHTQRCKVAFGAIMSSLL